MDTVDKYKYVNQGYNLAKDLPVEFKIAVKNKLEELSQTGKFKEKWQAMAKGYEMASLELEKSRKQELEQIKSQSRGKSKGRSR